MIVFATICYVLAVCFFIVGTSWMIANRVCRGTLRFPPKVGSYYRNIETGDIIKIDCNAITIWYGKVPNKDYRDLGSHHTMEYRDFYKKCKRIKNIDEELAMEEGLEALANL